MRIKTVMECQISILFNNKIITNARLNKIITNARFNNII